MAARLVRQQYTFHALKGRRVPPGTPGAEVVRKESSKWYAEGVPGFPAGKRIPLASNRRVADRMLAELVERAERGQTSLPDRAAGRKALADFLTAFESDLSLGLASRAKRNRKRPSPGQVALTVQRVRDVLAGCGFAYPADLADSAPARLAKYFADRTARPRKDGGVSHQTAAFYLAAARRFVWWLSAKARAPVRADLFDDVPGFDAANNRVHARRDCSAEELARLLDAARNDTRRGRNGPRRQTLPGPDRYFVYLVAFSTGYRAEELSHLTSAAFDLDADPPAVTLPGRHTKNKRAARQPLPPGVAAQLRGYLAGKPAGCPVWPGTWYKHAARMLRKDLAAAGIPYRADTPHGPAVLDFHALRHSFMSALAAAGVGPKELQELARHSDPRLTLGIYTHARPEALASSVARLRLPGADGENSLAGLTRSELEETVVALVAVATALAGLLTGPLTADLGTGGHGAEPGGTAKRRRKSA